MKIRNLSLSSQIFFLITSFILLLIILQFGVDIVLFHGYYMTNQIAQIVEDLRIFVQEI